MIHATKKLSHSLYLSYFNDFLTIGAFAAHYGLSVRKAHQVIRVGRRINHDNKRRENYA